MRACMCICVRMHAYVHACMHACLHTHTCLSVYVNVCACKCAMKVIATVIFHLRSFQSCPTPSSVTAGPKLPRASLIVFLWLDSMQFLHPPPKRHYMQHWRAGGHLLLCASDLIWSDLNLPQHNPPGWLGIKKTATQVPFLSFLQPVPLIVTGKSQITERKNIEGRKKERTNAGGRREEGGEREGGNKREGRGIEEERKKTSSFPFLVYKLVLLIVTGKTQITERKSIEGRKKERTNVGGRKRKRMGQRKRGLGGGERKNSRRKKERRRRKKKARRGGGGGGGENNSREEKRKGKKEKKGKNGGGEEERITKEREERRRTNGVRKLEQI